MTDEPRRTEDAPATRTGPAADSRRPLHALIDRIPRGYSAGLYRNVRYGITREDLVDGRSTKVFARELGGNDFVSLNYYRTSAEDILRPCEMPPEKVVRFLREVVLL